MKSKLLLSAIILVIVSVNFINAQTAYITNSFDNSVSVINVATNTVIDTIYGFNYPVGVTVSADGSKVYVTNNSDTTVSVISTATNTITATITVGLSPNGIVVSPDGSKVYVANESQSTVSVINTSTNAVSAVVPVGNGGWGITITPDGSKVYVANDLDYSVSVINTAADTIITTIAAVGSGPTGLAVSPDGSTLYVASASGSQLCAINTATDAILTYINVDLFPVGVVVSMDGSKVYVANQGNNSVNVISTVSNTVTNTIAVSSAPEGVSLSPDGSKLYVACSGSNNVNVINTVTDSITVSITVGAGPLAFGNFISTAMVPSFTYVSVNLACYGDSTGSITVSPFGGTGPYQYSNDGGVTWQSSNSFTGLASATYSLMVMDVNNNISNAQGVFISQPNAILTNQSYTICAGDFLVVGSNAYTHTGVYTDIVPAWNGCDSTITTNLTTHYGDVSVTTVGNSFTSNATGVTYQWTDCNNNYTPVNGATSQTFTPTVAGNYSVIITDIALGCVDTSACMLAVGINESGNNSEIQISPNPVTDFTTITFSEVQKNTTIKIIDMLGKEIRSINFSGKQLVIDKGEMQAGIYFVKMINENKSSIIRKIVIQ